MDNTSGSPHPTPLPIGLEAPAFELSSTPDQTVSPAEFRGQPVILAFYPEDWSPVCSDQMALYQELLPEFQKFNAELLGHLGGRGVEPFGLREGSEPAFPPARRLRAQGCGGSGLSRLSNR